MEIMISTLLEMVDRDQISVSNHLAHNALMEGIPSRMNYDDHQQCWIFKQKLNDT